MKLDDLPECLTVPQLASYLNIGRSTAYALVASGEIKSIRPNGVRVRKEVLREWIAEQEKGTTQNCVQ